MKASQKISLVLTVKNEASSISALLASIKTQTLPPDEIIITDAGSTDRTKDIIKSFQTCLPQLRLINTNGQNRSQGRNIAIRQAKHEIIAVTDAGCVLKSDWLMKITHPILKDEGDAVAGFYLTDQESLLARASAPFVAVMPDRLNPDIFLPSSRSIAFTKKAWQLAGRYPVKVNFCEDLLFAQKLAMLCQLVIQPKAIVYWQHYRGMDYFFRQISRYAAGDIEAGYRPHLVKIASEYFRYLLFMLYPVLFPVYLLWPIIKFYRYLKEPSAFILLPLFQVLTDFGIMLGSFDALLSFKFFPKTAN